MPCRQVAENRKRIAERRRKVWQLHVVAKLSLPEVAQHVGASERTIRVDLHETRKGLRHLLREARGAEEAVLDQGIDTASEIDAVIRQAWSDLAKAPEGSPVRARFLNVALKALIEKVKVLQSLGLLDKVPDEVIYGSIGTVDLPPAEAAEAYAALRACLAEIRRGTFSAAGGGGSEARQPAALDRGEPVDSDEGPAGSSTPV
jgi:hypothetical protein